MLELATQQQTSDSCQINPSIQYNKLPELSETLDSDSTLETKP